ncbi:type II toxin-antitoxin system prevent-host-death family antitoxin [Lancefieldella rimae]|uniref:type II toxin-antitoxin system prevent-host-death family antitoxin n=1 Tax=Lancefieldella rimae TaxID=1383 RepID=UPI0028EA9558|nr:type II toxin-antitoxin system prevent-host-death family antitoxin [Lancefieldella rimae]
MATCVPIKDMRDTAQFLKLVQSSNEPITVTKNGYSELVVMRAEDYDTLQDELDINKEKAHLFASLLASDDELRKGETYNAFDVLDELREKYDL